MKHTISLLVEDHAGVMSKVSGLFSRRGFNIDSLAVGPTELANISRITIVVDGDDSICEQVTKQLNKIIPVIKVKLLKENNYVSRVLTLFKVSMHSSNKEELYNVVNIMQAKIVDAAAKFITIEYSGTLDQTETFKNMLKPYGIKEIVQTGSISIEKGAERLNNQIK